MACRIRRTVYVLISFWLFASPSFADDLINLPADFPTAEEDDEFFDITLTNGTKVRTTINPFMQAHLTKYIKNRANPIATVVAVEVETGNILALVQGRSPKKWEANNLHTAVYPHFPAASLFKTVVASAAFELTDIDPLDTVGLNGGCANVRPTGIWLEDEMKGRRRQISLRRAFGQSCNGYFAKLAVNKIGLSIIRRFAMDFGWRKSIGSDFFVPVSPMDAPKVKTSSVHSVGRYAAGFGYVGISAAHAAWIMTALANKGVTKDLNIFADDSAKPVIGEIVGQDTLTAPAPKEKVDRLLSGEATEKLVSILNATVQGGTASFAFRRGKYRKMRYRVGGKTGTLSGRAPKGINTWFMGMMPLENPKVVVAAVVLLEKLWHIKGPNLAAEALWSYEKMLKKKALMVKKAEKLKNKM